MAFGGLILTNKGREALTKAQLGEALEFTGIAVGDGSYTGSYSDITSLAHELAVLDILRAEADGGVCVLEAELSNAGLTAGYYLREIGILAKNGEDTVLYAYTNAGTDAEYIPAGDGAVSVEKRLRFSLVTDSVSDIIFDAASVMYVEQKEFDEAVGDIRETLAAKQDRFAATVDLSGSQYDQDTWYPVTGTRIPKGGLHKIHVYSTFDAGAHPSWATNNAGYTCNMEVYDKAQTWGQTDGATICTDYSWKHTSQRPCGYIQMTHSSTPVLILRGGGIYNVITDYESEWTIRTAEYTLDGDTVRPISQSRFDFNRATIFANINGDVTAATAVFTENNSYDMNSEDSIGTLFGKILKFINTVKSIAPNFLSSGRVPLADKLNTKRYIDGVAFDGSANVAHYGTCSTAAATAAKTVSITGFSLVTGARVTVLFSNGNTAASPTLNVTSTGAKPIYYRGAAIPADYIQSGAVLSLVYSGSYWRVEGDLTDYLMRDRAPTDHASPNPTFGVASETYYGHVKASSTTPKAPGTAATGSETASFARGDHVHPLPGRLAAQKCIDGVGFDGQTNISHYGMCTTSAGTAAKTVSITGFSLVTGARIAVHFTGGNTAASLTLNVNDTGAKEIYYKNEPVPGDYIQRNTVLNLVYSGAYWRVEGDLTQYQVDTLKTDLDLIKSPTTLYSSTTGIYASALLTWEYTTVSNLSKWKEVRMWVEVGDAACGYQTFTRDKNTVIVNGYYSVGYNSTMRVLCDFTNNRVGIYVAGLTGWGFTQVRVLRIEGLIKNS